MGGRSGRARWFAGLALALVPAVSDAAVAAGAADPPWRLVSGDGKTSVQFGVLAQPQAERLTTPDGADTASNLFVRRFRFIAGGKVSDRVSFFIDTDSPNLGKGNASGRKDEPFFLQDVIITVRLSDEIQVDAGMLLTALSHNGGQGATSLLAADYGPYSFLYSDPTTCKTGRDYGVQARGYLFNTHLEYRAGVFQGFRGASATEPFRYVARAVWYPFEAETGFFYSGTNHGTRRILAVGASLDRQGDYTTKGADIYWDWKLRGGNGATAQGNLVRFDGGTTFRGLPRQDAWLVEAGFYHGRLKLGPFLQAAGREFAGASLAGERKVLGGVAWWVGGHRLNLKVGVGRLARDGGPTRTQVMVQGQVYVY